MSRCGDEKGPGQFWPGPFGPKGKTDCADRGAAGEARACRRGSEGQVLPQQIVHRLLQAGPVLPHLSGQLLCLGEKGLLLLDG